jgi:hypothetical protein
VNGALLLMTRRAIFAMLMCGPRRLQLNVYTWQINTNNVVLTKGDSHNNGFIISPSTSVLAPPPISHSFTRPVKPQDGLDGFTITTSHTANATKFVISLPIAPSKGLN